MKINKIIATGICLGITMGMGNYALAAENNSADSTNQDEFSLEGYVVTANRIKVKKIETAADIVVIDQKAIEDGNFKSVSEALKANNINVVQENTASYPIINGDSRVLVMVNGRKMNWSHLVVSGASGAINIDNFPIDNIKKIEIVRGPNSSLYGNNAVAGVINIITKAPQDGQKTTVKAQYGSWNDREASIVTEGGDDNLRYMLSYSKEKRDNYEYKTASGKNNEFPNSNIDKETETLRLDKKIGDDKLSFELENSKSKNGYGLYLTNPEAGIAYASDAKNETTELGMALTYTWKPDADGNGDYLRLYQNKEDSDAPLAATSYSHNLKTWGAEYQKNWHISDKNTLIGGTSFIHEQIHEENAGTAFSKEADTKSIYLEDHWKFADGWSINAGGRYENNSTFGGDVTSHISLNKILSPVTNAYISWGQAVNNPTLKQLYADSAFWAGNPDLQQEKSHTLTLGVNSQLAKNTSMELSVYTSRVTNALEWVSGAAADGRGMYENVAEEKRRGLEFNINRKLSDQWSVRTGYSYSKVEENVDGNFQNYEENNRPNGYLLGISYNQDKWKGDLNIQRVTGRSTQYFTDSKYTTIDFNLNYKLNDLTKIYLQGINLTNESYEVVGYSKVGAYAMPGRHFVVGIERQF